MADLQIPESEHYQEAIDSVRKRVPVPRAVWNTMQTEEREHAFTVSQVTRTQVLQQVLDAIDKAVTTGTTIGDFRDEVADKLIDQWGGEIPGRIENIFRTNIGASYAEGRHAINSAPAVKEARPYWRYNDTDNDRECETCHNCHGVILPADHPWWLTHHPLLHYCCCCEVDALSPDEAAEEGVDDEGPEVDVDEGFGNQPSSEGKDWAPDLSNIDPELRAALEAKLAEIQGELFQPPTPRAPETEPEPEPEIEPSPAEKIAQQVEDFADDHVDRSYETALIVGSDGATVFKKRGQRSSVGFTRSELDRMADTHLVHNHPSGTSLSPADLNVAMHTNANSIVAVGRDRLTGKVNAYSFNRPSGGWPIREIVSRVMAAANREVEAHLGSAVSHGKITPEQASLSHWNEVWTRCQKQVDLGYKVVELKPNKKRRK